MAEPGMYEGGHFTEENIRWLVNTKLTDESSEDELTTVYMVGRHEINCRRCLRRHYEAWRSDKSKIQVDQIRRVHQGAGQEQRRPARFLEGGSSSV